MDLAPISSQKHHDRATIRPRLRFDRAPRFLSIVVESGRSDSAAKEVQSRLDRTAILGFFRALSAPSDGALQVRWMVTITRHRGRQIAIESHSIHHQGAPSPAVRSAKKSRLISPPFDSASGERMVTIARSRGP